MRQFCFFFSFSNVTHFCDYYLYFNLAFKTQQRFGAVDVRSFSMSQWESLSKLSHGPGILILGLFDPYCVLLFWEVLALVLVGLLFYMCLLTKDFQGDPCKQKLTLPMYLHC